LLLPLVPFCPLLRFRFSFAFGFCFLLVCVLGVVCSRSVRQNHAPALLAFRLFVICCLVFVCALPRAQFGGFARPSASARRLAGRWFFRLCSWFWPRRGVFCPVALLVSARSAVVSAAPTAGLLDSGAWCFGGFLLPHCLDSARPSRVAPLPVPGYLLPGGGFHRGPHFRGSRVRPPSPWVFLPVGFLYL
jgi:hypothetical protein